MLKQIPKQIYCFLSSWLIAVTVEYMLISKTSRSLTDLSGIAEMSLNRVLCITSLLVIIWNLLSLKISDKPLFRWIAVYTFAVYATVSVIDSFTWPFLIACILILAILIVFAVFGQNYDTEKQLCEHKERKIYTALSWIAPIIFLLFLSFWGVARVKSFAVPTFDFGIFSQMFHNMKETGLPMTTVERDGMLSHFDVHVSPIYYLILPFYCLFPYPETLQTAQAVILASAAIPLFKLGKHHGLHPALRLLICVALLCYPSYAGGTSYDLHENCFLTPLILWLLYGFDRKNIAISSVSAILTLCVKEDAAVYVAVAALYLTVRSVLEKDKKRIIFGIAVLVVSTGWFFAVTSYLKESGDGLMSDRYRNFMFDSSDSLFTVIKVIFLCPLKAVFECVDAEKLQFTAYTMLPLLGLPLMTRRYERLLLLIPYILINLMSDYPYQHDIMFQYTFGSTAMLFYLVTVNISDLKIKQSGFVLTALTVCISFTLFYIKILPVGKQYITSCITNSERFEARRTALDTVPDGVSVAATTFNTVYLSDRAVLYDIYHSSKENVFSCDYIVIDTNDIGAFKKYETDEKDGKENFITMIFENGYILKDTFSENTQIYVKSEIIG